MIGDIYETEDLMKIFKCKSIDVLEKRLIETKTPYKKYKGQIITTSIQAFNLNLGLDKNKKNIELSL